MSHLGVVFSVRKGWEKSVVSGQNVNLKLIVPTEFLLPFLFCRLTHIGLDLYGSWKWKKRDPSLMAETYMTVTTGVLFIDQYILVVMFIEKNTYL